MSIDGFQPTEKKVDEAWKEQIEKDRLKAEEKQTPQDAAGQQASAKPAVDQQASGEGAAQPPAGEEGDDAFKAFLSTLSMQALMSLGEIPHPVTQQTETDLTQAQYLINMLEMLQRKTAGNLLADEATLLENVLYELRMKFVEKSKPPPPPAQP